MQALKRISIFVMHGDDDTDFNAVSAWLEKWKDKVIVAEYNSGGWEHYWDLEASDEAIAEVHEDWLCDSDWCTNVHQPTQHKLGNKQ